MKSQVLVFCVIATILLTVPQFAVQGQVSDTPVGSDATADQRGVRTPAEFEKPTGEVPAGDSIPTAAPGGPQIHLLAPPVACPLTTTIWGQDADDCDGSWAASSSAVFPDGDPIYLMYESFPTLGTQVCGVRWWGLILHFNGGWVVCEDPDGLTFEIKFYTDDAGMPGAEMCAYTFVVAEPARIDLCNEEYPLFMMHRELDPCCYRFLSEPGWVSIQSLEDVANGCVFLWMSGTGGDSLSVREDVLSGVFTYSGFDRGVCLTNGPYCCPGDSNCDCVVSWCDIDFFIAALGDDVEAWEAMFLPGTPSCNFCNNDVNGDGTADWRDIIPFVALINTTCQSCPY